MGDRLIDAQTALDRASKIAPTPAGHLAGLTAAIGNHQGALRAVHKYHLTTAEPLTADQSRRYAVLRVQIGAPRHLDRLGCTSPSQAAPESQHIGLQPAAHS